MQNIAREKNNATLNIEIGKTALSFRSSGSKYGIMPFKFRQMPEIGLSLRPLLNRGAILMTQKKPSGSRHESALKAQDFPKESRAKTDFGERLPPARRQRY